LGDGIRSAGHWQVPRTEWKLPIEDNSTGRRSSTGRLTCTRSRASPMPRIVRVSLGAAPRENAHLVRHVPGRRQPHRSRGHDDVLWSGKWPANRSRASARPLSPFVHAPDPRWWLPAGLECRLDVTDPDGDTLAIAWTCARMCPATERRRATAKSPRRHRWRRASAEGNAPRCEYPASRASTGCSPTRATGTATPPPPACRCWRRRRSSVGRPSFFCGLRSLVPQRDPRDRCGRSPRRP